MKHLTRPIGTLADPPPTLAAANNPVRQQLVDVLRRAGYVDSSTVFQLEGVILKLQDLE
jgi:hypothetical protein